jgi:hypothetical protein
VETEVQDEASLLLLTIARGSLDNEVRTTNETRQKLHECLLCYDGCTCKCPRQLGHQLQMLSQEKPKPEYV